MSVFSNRHVGCRRDSRSAVPPILSWPIAFRISIRDSPFCRYGGCTWASMLPVGTEFGIHANASTAATKGSARRIGQDRLTARRARRITNQGFLSRGAATKSWLNQIRGRNWRYVWNFNPVWREKNSRLSPTGSEDQALGPTQRWCGCFEIASPKQFEMGQKHFLIRRWLARKELELASHLTGLVHRI